MKKIGFASLLLAGTILVIASRTNATPTIVTADEICDSIEGNLSAIGSVTADVSCTSSDENQTFTGGWMAADGVDKFMINRGDTEEFVWYDENAFNISHAGESIIHGMRWDDSSGFQFTHFGYNCGFIDPRVAVTAVGGDTSDLAVDQTPVTINGISCYKMYSNNFRIYVQANNKKRLIRFEADYEDNGGLGLRVDYSGWATISNVGDLPNQIDVCIYESGTSNVDIGYTYYLSNIVVEADVSSLDFTTWVPPDSGE